MSRLPSLSVDSNKVVQLIHYGQALHEMGMGFKALQQYDIALEINPKSAVVYHRKGLLYFSKQQHIHALRCYEQALYQPNYFDVYYDKGNAHLALNQVDKAIENYAKALSHFPDRAVIYYQLGVAHYQKGNVVTALKFLAQSLERDQNLIIAIQKQGEIYYDLKMYRKALKHYDKILKFDALNYKAQYSKGLTYFEMDQKDKAQFCFDRCILLQPNYSLPYFNNGVIFSQKGDHREAIRCFKESLKRNPDNHKARYQLGLCFQRLGQYEKALQSYSQCPLTHEVIFNQGVIQQKMKMYYKAQELFKKAITQKKDKIDYWYNLGINYYYLDKFMQMADCFEKVISLGGTWVLQENQNQHPAIVQYLKMFILQPTQSTEFYKQGRAFCLVQQFDKAILSFKSAIQVNPSYLDAKLELAKVYENNSQYQEAIMLYKSIEDIKAKQQLSALCLHLKLYQQAIFVLDKTLQIQPRNVEAIYNKGLSLIGESKYQMAIECFEEVLKQQPQNAEAIYQKGKTSKYPLGIIYESTGEREKAEVQFLKIINFTADNELILLLQGHSYFRVHKFIEAISSYEKAIAKNYSFSDAYFGLGFLYYTKQEYLLAIKAYKQYLFQAPKSTQFLLALSKALQKLGKTKRALKRLDEILLEDKYHHEATHYKATIFFENKRYQEAFLQYQRAIQLRPRYKNLIKILYYD